MCTTGVTVSHATPSTVHPAPRGAVPGGVRWRADGVRGDRIGRAERRPGGWTGVLSLEQATVRGDHGHRGEEPRRMNRLHRYRLSEVDERVRQRMIRSTAPVDGVLPADAVPLRRRVRSVCSARPFLRGTSNACAQPARRASLSPRRCSSHFLRAHSASARPRGKSVGARSRRGSDAACRIRPRSPALHYRYIGPRVTAPMPWPACRAIRTCTTRGPRAAGSGKPPTPVRTGIRSSTASPSRRSAPSPSRRRTRTWCGWEQANRSSAATSRSAGECTSRRMPARRGRTWAWRTRDGSRASRSTPRIRIACSWPRSGTRTGRSPSAAFSARPMAARRGTRCCS